MESDGTLTKPPLGCMPAYVSSGRRIEELSEAITRNVKSDASNVENIQRWAKEILFHCEIMQKC